MGLRGQTLVLPTPNDRKDPSAFDRVRLSRDAGRDETGTVEERYDYTPCYGWTSQVLIRMFLHPVC